MQKVRKRKASRPLPVLHPKAAGIDVASNHLVVAVPPELDPDPVRTFEGFTEDLQSLADWLIRLGIETIAMESTSTYWIPIFQILEGRGMHVCLVNARHVKGVPGRKTDVQDAEWLRYLHSVGLLRGSYRPPDAVCAVRSLLRQRQHLVSQAGMHVQLMQKALSQMNLQLHNVISDIMGVSGQRILRAVLDGQRDPMALAMLCDGRIHADARTVAKSLRGDWRPEHVFVLRQCLGTWDHLQAQVGELDKEIFRMMREFDALSDGREPPASAKRPQSKPKCAPDFDLRGELFRLFGVDLTQVPGIDANTAWVFFSEVGRDLSRFATTGHFCSWLGLCPGSSISGGKVLSSKTRKVVNRLATALRVAAQALWRAKNPMGDLFRSYRLRLGVPKAVTAMAHRLARILFVMVRDRKAYDQTELEKMQRQQDERKKRRLKREAERMGFKLVAA